MNDQDVMSKDLPHNADWWNELKFARWPALIIVVAALLVSCGGVLS